MKNSIRTIFAAIFAASMIPSAQAAQLVLQNSSSTDTLYAAALVSTDASQRPTALLGQGFWTIKPGERRTLFDQPHRLREVWLRIFIKNDQTSREYSAQNSEKITLEQEGEGTCKWVGNEPTSQHYICTSPTKFAPFSRRISVDLGMETGSNFLRDCILANKRYTFFRMKLTTTDDQLFLWK